MDSVSELSKIDCSNWEELKEEGNRLYKEQLFAEAYKLYQDAVQCLETPDNNNYTSDITQEQVKIPQDVASNLAKLYSNLSVSMYQMAQTENTDSEKKVRLEKALADGEKAVKYDADLDKAHFRCALSLNALSRKDDIIPYATKILALYKKQRKDYTSDKHVLKILADCEYFNRKFKSTPLWEAVKWKDNYKVIGKNEKADCQTLNQSLITGHTNLSLVLQPGYYRLQLSLVISKGQDIQILGDVRQDKDRITIECVGGPFDSGICHLFHIKGGKLSISNVCIRQASLHPELHALYAENGGEAELINCNCYSKCSGCIAANGASKLIVRECTFDKACGGVIVVGDSTAIVEKSTFSDLVRIGVEARDNSELTVKDCKLSNCGAQAVTVHAGAKGATVLGCTFTNNSCKMEGTEPAISCASGKSVVKNCEFLNNRGGGIMLQDGGYCAISACTMRNGRYGVGASSRGEGWISNNTILGCTFGLCIVYNQNGKIILENNKIKVKTTEVMLSPSDIPPEIIGENGPNIVTDVSVSDEHMREGLEQLKLTKDSDHFGSTKPWMDPRDFDPRHERICSPCGMSQRTLDTRFMMCRGCKVTWYCSKACQQKDWKVHKEMCKNTKDLMKPKQEDLADLPFEMPMNLLK